MGGGQRGIGQDRIATPRSDTIVEKGRFRLCIARARGAAKDWCITAHKNPIIFWNRVDCIEEYADFRKLSQDSARRWNRVAEEPTFKPWNMQRAALVPPYAFHHFLDELAHLTSAGEY